MTQRDRESLYREKFQKNNPILKSRRGKVGETWWSKRFVASLENISVSSRLARGKSYARNGYVASITYHGGVVKAKVRGSRRTPYTVTITFCDYTDDEWDSLIDGMAGQAIIAARLLAGEMPEELEEVFAAAGLPLFPRSEGDIITTCSCPDWENPCKHIAAVYYILAEWFDENPFFLFGLWGMGREEMLGLLRELRGAAAGDGSGSPAEDDVTADDARTGTLQAPEGFLSEDDIRHFWKVGPELDSFKFRFHDAPVPAIQQLGSSPFMLGRKNLSERLLPVYPAAREYAYNMTGMKDEK